MLNNYNLKNNNFTYLFVVLSFCKCFFEIYAYTLNGECPSQHHCKGRQERFTNNCIYRFRLRQMYISKTQKSPLQKSWFSLFVVSTANMKMENVIKKIGNLNNVKTNFKVAVAQ